MKKNITILFIIVFLIACNNIKNEQQNSTTSNDSSLPSESCYAYQNGQDSIKMQLKTLNNNAQGTLYFNYFEKDANAGTFSGTLNADTLWAIYTFTSEGTQSKREIVFLKQGDEWVQGYGEVIEKDSIFVFKNHQDIRFDNAFPLERIECEPTF